ncbi:MAG TPA: HlyD family secretion protein [Candidatus Saccharimonadales bacterium]|nr:HlyD family secretion protein [Candidatus Saccharimonadales bacterium]
MPTYQTNKKEEPWHPVAAPPDDNPQTKPPKESNEHPPERPKKRRKWTFIVLGILAIAGAIYGFRTIVFFSGHVQTDDAQIEGHISPVIPQVSGYVTEVLVEDNQRVAAGQVLVRIDTREIEARQRLAEAALQTASATMREAKGAADAAQARRENALSDLTRQRKLFESKTVSPQEFQNAKSAADSASASYRAALSEVSAAEASIAQRQAELDNAKLQLAFTRLRAPIAGTAARKNVELGQYVQPGQPLVAIANDIDAWVVANFKETQVRKIRVGQNVEVRVDAYPKTKFLAKVDSFAPATGARFSLLPPENASGNFVKVVQRIPVKITFEHDENFRNHPLRIGMNVVPTVIVK